jgi:hypothetical protein
MIAKLRIEISSWGHSYPSGIARPGLGAPTQNSIPARKWRRVSRCSASSDGPRQRPDKLLKPTPSKRVRLQAATRWHFNAQNAWVHSIASGHSRAPWRSAALLTPTGANHLAAEDHGLVRRHLAGQTSLSFGQFLAVRPVVRSGLKQHCHALSHKKFTQKS